MRSTNQITDSLRRTLVESKRSQISNKYKLSIGYEDLSLKILENYMIICEENGRKLEDGVNVKDVCDVVSKWLTNDENKNSLYIAGELGVGKTTIAKAIYRTLGKAMLCSGIGAKMISAYQLGDIMLNSQDFWSYSLIKGDFCEYLIIDDLGLEPQEIKYYGTPVTPFVNLLIEREIRHLPIIVTSNLPFENIAEVYGDRVADRMRGMFNQIIIKGVSHRK